MTGRVSLTASDVRVLRALATAVDTPSVSGLRRAAVPVWDVLEGLGLSDLAVTLQRVPSDVRRALWAMRDAGLVEITPRSWWSITPAGRAALADADRGDGPR